MPLDSREFGPLVFTPGKEGLSKLAHVLRHSELWPAGFAWDFSDCRTCALGMMYQLWPETHSDYGPTGWLCHGDVVESFGVTQFASWQLFTNQLARRLGKLPHDVTPGDVADGIDRYLASSP